MLRCLLDPAATAGSIAKPALTCESHVPHTGAPGALLSHRLEPRTSTLWPVSKAVRWQS